MLAFKRAAIPALTAILGRSTPNWGVGLVQRLPEVARSIHSRQLSGSGVNGTQCRKHDSIAHPDFEGKFLEICACVSIHACLCACLLILKCFRFQNATLRALDGPDPLSAKELAVHSLFAPGDSRKTYELQLSVDVPSATTGTGNALLLDGRDTGMIRVSVVDSSNHNALVPTNFERVTWRVISGTVCFAFLTASVSVAVASRFRPPPTTRPSFNESLPLGPGVIAGTANGDSASHEWLKSPTVNVSLGLARAFVRVTLDCTSPNIHLVPGIDLDNSRSPTVIPASASRLLFFVLVVFKNLPLLLTVVDSRSLLCFGD